MRHVRSLLIAISAVAGLTGSAMAQPTVRDHRNPPAAPPAANDKDKDRDHNRDRRPPPVGPTEAPPAPREEKMAARAGFEWVGGRWDWRTNKWEWIPGHWERERAGKHWNPGRWDRQGDRWAWVEGGWADGPRPGGPVGGPPPGRPDDGRPREAPPPPRVEEQGARAGFTFVRGRWDWRTNKWEWIPGHWERERPGKTWREARWEQRDGVFILVDGEWIDVTAPNSPTHAPPIVPDRPDRPRRNWNLDRPTVSSYWPVKGKAAGRIVIRGRNFPADTVVVWNNAQVPGAKVTPDEIIVAVPPNATTGFLALRTGRGRDLSVGMYEVADYDAAAAAAEAARKAEEARKRAEAQWAERQRQLAKDRAARQAELDRHRQEWQASREQRREDRLREIRARWQAAFLADADTQAELTLHAQRVAEIGRMREIAELTENGKLVIRIGVAESREEARHQERMDALQAAFGRKP